ncbi:MAG TPA: hypothetical protein VE990_13365 [Acidimicrobiales bacterium]|nr:hypothetical protein [Acidimicrobiales bacterium]
MPRKRIYGSNAERQAAYRVRTAEKVRALAGNGALQQIKTLEAELANAERRASQAEAKAEEARRALRMVRPRPAGPTLAAALRDEVESLRRRVVVLEMLVEGLEGELTRARQELEVARRPPSGQPNRAERRAEAKRTRQGR